MIEIITEEVVMPTEKRYVKNANHAESKKWWVEDTHNNNAIVFKGKFEDVVIACHNLNKKFYKNNPVKD